MPEIDSPCISAPLPPCLRCLSCRSPGRAGEHVRRAFSHLTFIALLSQPLSTAVHLFIRVCVGGSVPGHPPPTRIRESATAAGPMRKPEGASPGTCGIRHTQSRCTKVDFPVAFLAGMLRRKSAWLEVGVRSGLYVDCCIASLGYHSTLLHASFSVPFSSRKGQGVVGIA